MQTFSAPRRPFIDRIGKYFVDPRRIPHRIMLQSLLCLFATGPSFFDNFFSASVVNIMETLDISHETFSMLISVPSLMVRDVIYAVL